MIAFNLRKPVFQRVSVSDLCVSFTFQLAEKGGVCEAGHGCYGDGASWVKFGESVGNGGGQWDWTLAGWPRTVATLTEHKPQD